MRLIRTRERQLDGFAGLCLSLLLQVDQSGHDVGALNFDDKREVALRMIRHMRTTRQQQNKTKQKSTYINDLLECVSKWSLRVTGQETAKCRDVSADARAGGVNRDVQRSDILEHSAIS